jgi:hypothetical protein
VEQLAMTRYQLLLLPVVIAAVLILSGALKHKAVDGGQSHVPIANTDNDPQAQALLDQAIDALSPERVRWLQAAVWQQAHCEDFTYQACGRLLTAPGDRARFDLNVRVGKVKGELRLVCNGQTLQRSIHVGDEEAVVTHVKLPALDKPGKDPADLARARTEVLQEEGFAGLSPLLSSLRQELQNVQCQHQTWKGHEVIVISGAWPDDTARSAPVPQCYRPRFHARFCCIYLDARTFWPHRLEWWGSEKPNQPNTLLMQTEFRDAVINRALAAEQSTAEFAVDP